MALPLSTSQERIERSLYEVIRLVLVAEGYLPDITTFPNTVLGTAAYQTAMQAVEASKGFCIELFGAGGIKEKNQKKVPRMILQTRRILTGEIGNQPNPLYEPDDEDNPTEYAVVTLPSQTSNIQIDIKLLSTTQRQDRIMTAVIGKAISNRKFIPTYDDPEVKFFIHQIGYNDFHELLEGITEKTYSLEIPDLYLTEVDTGTPVAPINEITVVPTADTVPPVVDDELIIT